MEVVQSTLANITVEQVKLLPIMTDKSKLNAMHVQYRIKANAGTYIKLSDGSIDNLFTFKDDI